ncbi:MAG: CNNM domain-containing protein [Thermoguttaceae bacterium]|nr:CNNM domain-containing protein [Thermoguttaceae bacterium]MDW8039226.1 CNNM domain-containing protein [Thermoguttaceae bacterium]
MNHPMVALLIGGIGLALSAFFSGSETGLYRASRIRLRLEAIEGDRLAGLLLWLVHRPGLFVATALVGNNLANNMVSLAVVLLSQQLFPQPGHLAELTLTALLAPIIFVYGELLPKYLFLRAPNRLLRHGGGLFFVFTLLFLPVSIFIWAVNFLADRLGGGWPQPIRMRLARRELRRILQEAHEVGVFQPFQHQLAEAIFTLAELPVSRFVLPLDTLPRVPSDTPKNALFQSIPASTDGHIQNVILLEDALQPGHLLGYVELWQMGLQKENMIGPVRPLPRFSEHQSVLSALVEMERAKARLALLENAQGTILGLVSLAQLREQLFARSLPKAV